jgi:hypothetical protein
VRRGGAVVMIGAVCFVGLTCAVSPQDLKPKPTPQERAAIQAREDAKWERYYQGEVRYAKRAEAKIEPYEKITDNIRKDVEAGYSPPPIGEETEGGAQARILANCRAGFTDEVAPATGSGTMDCDELEQDARE